MKIHVFSKTSSVREITDSKDPALVTPAVVAGKGSKEKENVGLS